jgi:DMSO reductase family type II enzyme molybdopterin subunit
MRLALELAHLEAPQGLASISRFDLWEMRSRPIPWDRIVKVTHPIDCAFNWVCAFNAFVWKGVVLREEQAANYPPPNDPRCPDLNPRGCNKGVAFAHRMYDPTRIKHPYKRAGERGEGKWQRLSWDQALDEIADKLLEIILTEGPKTIFRDGGIQGHGSRAGWSLCGFPASSINIELGDEHQGALETFGNSGFGHSDDNAMYTDLIMIWGGNPAYSQITNYHFITEGRYNGAKVVVICPDYSASALCADEWVPVRPGTDAALALGMAQVILEEGLYNTAFIKEQTDLPLLVRTDNGKFLRESDIRRGGRPYVYFLFDASSGKVVPAPHTTLDLGPLDPALDGTYEVETLQGRVQVRPAFSLLREMLDRHYRPEQAADMCGVPPETIRRLAREFAQAQGVINIATFNINKYYHGNLMERAMIYLWALCGHLGRRGASYGAMQMPLIPDRAVGTWQRPAQDLVPRLVNHPNYPYWRERGFDSYRILREVMRENPQSEFSMYPTPFLWFFHAGQLELSKRYNSWDPHLKRPLEDYLREGLERNQAHTAKKVWPPPGKEPRALFVWGGDVARRVRANQFLVQELFPKLKLLVTVDFRWNGSALYSDYVLPACGFYEHTYDATFGVFNFNAFHFSFKAVEPLYESKSDWWIIVMLVRRLAEKARARGIISFTDPDTGEVIPLGSLDEALTGAGLYTEDDEDAITRDAYLSSTNLEMVDWEEVERRGHVRFTEPGLLTALAGDLAPGEPIVPLTRHVRDKVPYETATGRIQFYIDHDWYLELGEAFACHKEPIKAGGDYPIQLLGGHSRWSINSVWADDALLLQLQRGEPLLWLSPQDAQARGIRDGDRVEAFNDVGSFQAQAVVSPRIPPGVAFIYHQWTAYQFPGWRHFQQVMPNPFNPVEYAPATGMDYPNVAMEGPSGAPGGNDRDTRVDVRKAPP